MTDRPITASAFDPTDKHSTATAALTAFAFLLIYLLLMPATELWDRDEPLYARTAIEMLRSGDWFLPQYNGNLFAHKPPMTYWFMAASFSLFGENEFAARFISGPAMAGSAFMTYLIARQMFDHVTGLWAMIIFGTSLMTFYLGSIAQHDALLLLFILIGLWAYICYIYGRQTLWPMLLVFTMAMTATLYIKGPVGPAVLCATLLVSWLFMARDERPTFWTMSLFAIGLLLALLIFSLWLVPANNATEGALVEMGVGKHIIQRFQAPLENYGGTAALGYYWMLPAYIPIVLILFMPWTIHLPAGFKGLISGTIGNRQTRAILWGWLVPTFLMFSIAGSKLPHYIFPIWPALGILSASIMVRQWRQGTALPLSKFGAWLYISLSPGLALALLIVPFMLPDVIPIWLGVPSGIALMLFAYMVFEQQRSGNTMAASRLLAIGSPIIILLAYWMIVPRAEPMIKISKQISTIINQAGVSKDHIYMQGYLEPSMVFYISAPLNNPVRNLPENNEAVRALIETNNGLVLVAKQARFDEINALFDTPAFEILGTVRAINTNADLESQNVVVGVARSAN